MRIRTIKPEYFVHEGLFDLERETGFPIRVAFAGLWCAADRRGRFKDEPRKLKVQILPYDDVDFSRVLDALSTRGFIVKHACSEGSFYVIPSFEKHQVINNRERESELPDPAGCQRVDACPTRAPRVTDACCKEGKGREPSTHTGAEPPSMPQAPEPVIPTAEEVETHGDMVGVPAEYCAYYHATCDEKHRWVTGNGHLLDWRREMKRWWETDRVKARWAKGKAAPDEPPRVSAASQAYALKARLEAVEAESPTYGGAASRTRSVSRSKPRTNPA